MTKTIPNSGAAVLPGPQSGPQLFTASAAPGDAPVAQSKRIVLIELGELGSVNEAADQVGQGPLFTVPEAAELSGLHERSIRKAIQAKRLQAERVDVTSGKRTGHKDHRITLENLVKFSPQAEASWTRRQQAAQAQAEAAAAQQEAARQAADGVAHLKDWQRLVMDARLAVLGELERMMQARNIGRDQAVSLLVAQALEGRLPEPLRDLIPQANARKGQSGSRSLSRRSIYRWMQEARSGKAALAPQAKGFVEPRWAKHLLKLYRQPQKPSLAQVVAELPHVLPSDISAPSYSQARRFLDKVGAVERETGRMLPRELKTILPCKRRDTAVLGAPLVATTADGHTFDSEVAHPFTGKPFRPELTPILDLYTKRIVGVSVGLAESGFVVMEALRQCVIQYGVPAIFYVDNGSGYKNHWVRGVMERIGCTMTHSIAYNSQARGCIEVLHRTVWINLCAKRLKTFIGAQMDREAKQIAYKATRRDESQLIPWQDFLVFAKATLEAYNARPHKSLPWTQDERGRRVHQSPDQAWEQCIQGGWRPTLCTESLDELLPTLERKVSRGEINLHGNLYFSKALKEVHGEMVRVAFDPWDARNVWVRDREGRFLAEAVIDGNKTDYFPKPFIQTAIEQRQAAADMRAAVKRDRHRDLPGKAPAVIVELTEDQRASAARQLYDLGATFEAPATVDPENECGPMRPHFDNRKDYVARVLGHPDQWPPEDVEEARRMLSGDDDLRLWISSDPETAHLVAPPSAANAS